MKKLSIPILLFFTLFGNRIMSQDHWETAIYAYDQWHYFVGESEPESNWKSVEFNDNDWQVGPGSIGYGDGDDLTEIESTISLYIRRTFNIEDIAQLNEMILHADYDDGFIASVNGVEIARSANMGVPETFFGFDDEAWENHEASMYQGGIPEAYLAGIDLENILTNGLNVFAVQIHNVNVTSSDLSSIFFLSFSVVEGSSFFGDVPEWFYEPLDYTICNLPIFSINTFGEEIVGEPRIPAHLGIIDNIGENSLYDEFNGYDGSITIERRGNSSQWQPKPPYRFETVNDDGSNNNVSLLGMPEENDWVLYAPWSDKSLVRNVLTYHLSNTMGRYASRSRFCELFINGDYRGVYVLMEKLKRDNNRIDIEELSPDETEGDDLTGGYILKFDWGGTGENNGGFNSEFDGMLYNYHYPKPDEIAEEQEEYIYQFIYNFESIMVSANYNDLETGYSNITNTGSFVDMIILQELSKNVDAYRLSTYIYKDIDSFDGRLTAGPVWDINHGYGNCDYGETWLTDGWLLEYNPEGGDQMTFWWELMWQDEYFQTQVNERWNYLRSNILTEENINFVIDSLVNHIGNAQIKNFNRWPTLGQYVWPNYYVFDTYEEEVDYLKNWTFERIEWIDSEFTINDEPSFPDLLINEFLSSNDSTNVDESGEYDDWLEIYNGNANDVNLDWFYLTDNPDNLTKWVFPEGSVIPANGHMLIWCDEEQEQGLFHTNFKLSSNGEFIALVAGDGFTIIDSMSFGPQTVDVSYGRVPDGNAQWLFMTPTPGAANSGSANIDIIVELQSGWNLIGLPLYTENTYYQYLFPGSVSGTLYGFNGTYLPGESLTSGNGYWLNFPDVGSTTINGTPINELTISLSQGWNLISGISEVVDVASISDPGGVIVPGTLYGFLGTYVSSSQLDPGQGYWINANADGDVTISSGASGRAITSYIDRTKEANRLSFNGNNLYFGVSIPGQEMSSYQLPPKPPEGTFDVRFKDGWKAVKDYGKVEVMSTTETLTIAYDIQINAGNQYNWVLSSESGDHILENTGEVTVPSADRFILKRESALPETFTLYQNYPNPFNPITILRYDLPEQSYVTLTIYDMLGREITRLVSTTQEAGFRLVQWRGTDNMGRAVSAGVYLYQIRAGEFVQTKKMVLLK